MAGEDAVVDYVLHEHFAVLFEENHTTGSVHESNPESLLWRKTNAYPPQF